VDVVAGAELVNAYDLQARLTGVTFGPQAAVKAGLADLIKSVAAIDKKIDAKAKDLAEVKAVLTAAQVEQKVAKTKVLIRQIETACEQYEKEQNIYPADGEGELVKALAETMGPRGIPYMGRGEFIKDGGFVDVWGNPIQYQNNSTDPPPANIHNTNRIDIYSFGPNGKDDKGAGDDLTNWRQ
jgi:hypothetical protein